MVVSGTSLVTVMVCGLVAIYEDSPDPPCPVPDGTVPVPIGVVPVPIGVVPVPIGVVPVPLGVVPVPASVVDDDSYPVPGSDVYGP